MYRDPAHASQPPGESRATVRVIHQAIGVLMVRRGTSIADADAYLSASATTMDVTRAALSRLLIDSLNARGTGRSG